MPKILTLKFKYINEIRKDPIIQGEMAKANDKAVSTVLRWIREEDQMLTTATNRALIRYHLQLDESVDLCEPKRELVEQS